MPTIVSGSRPGGQHGSPRPTAQQISAVFSPGASTAQTSPNLTSPNLTGPASISPSATSATSTRFAEYIIKQTGVIELAFQNQNVIAALIYICGGVNAGVLQAMHGTTYVGRVQKYLTEIRVIGDENTPVLISETSTSEVQSAQVWVKGTAGDVLVLIYR
jgi:hypothetical protein